MTVWFGNPLRTCWQSRKVIVVYCISCSYLFHNENELPSSKFWIPTFRTASSSHHYKGQRTVILVLFYSILCFQLPSELIFFFSLITVTLCLIMMPRWYRFFFLILLVNCISKFIRSSPYVLYLVLCFSYAPITNSLTANKMGCTYYDVVRISNLKTERS